MSNIGLKNVKDCKNWIEKMSDIGLKKDKYWIEKCQSV
jgi:hypothetical protein